MNTNISRRDYFAAKAMQASTFQQFAVAIVKAIAPDNQRVTLGIAPETTAREAYRIADAMIAASGEPSTADAAELQRLRKVEDEAADAFDRRLEEEQDGSYSIPVNEWSRWRAAREARIAFDAANAKEQSK